MMSVHATRQPGRLCVSIGLQMVDEAIDAAEQVACDADVIEIRLDTLKDPDVSPFIRRLKTPLLFTFRPDWEGGLYTGEESVRIDVLQKAITEGAAYIDLELKAPKKSFEQLLPAITASNTKFIVSHHFFDSTPDSFELLSVLKAMKDSGADIGKIVTTAHDHLDVLKVLHLQKDADELDFPLIAFCMGRAGVISRLATLELGGFMTYCARNEEDVTAPGQIPVGTMRKVLASLKLDEGLNPTIGDT